MSSSVIAIVVSFFVKGGKLALYHRSLFVSFHRLPSEEDIFDNFCSRIYDLYFERYFLSELASLLYIIL